MPLTIPRSWKVALVTGGLLQAWPRLRGLGESVRLPSPDGDVLAEAALPVDLGVSHPLSPLSPLGKSYAPATLTRRAVPGDPKSPASTCDSK